MSRTKEVDLTEDELDIKAAKAKLSMWIDGDILEAIRLATKKQTGSTKGYQTFLNKKLREIFLNEVTEIDPKRIAEIEKRLGIIEKVVLKKHG
jgi:hypothetical protein